MDILKMRASSYLLPDPGGEVVRECLGEIERLNAAILFIAAIAERAKGDTAGIGPALRSIMTSVQGAEA